MTAPAAYYLPARAKLNLWLEVTGRRADGYHLLHTLFHPLDLHDDLWVARAAAGVQLDVTAAAPELQVDAGPDNLVGRALAALQRAAAAPHGFAAHLHKRIPHGGGLGGGSSDAAAALRLGNRLLDRPLPDAALHELARGLGADVPFFLRGGSQWAAGIGDELRPAAVPPLWFVLLLPPFPCPTAAVYKIHAQLWQSGPPQGSVSFVSVPHHGDSAVQVGLRNDLEAAAERLRPALRELRQQVAAAGYPGVRMAGSGSTLFVACASAAAQRRCLDDLAALGAAGVRLLATASGPPALEPPVPRAFAAGPEPPG